MPLALPVASFLFKFGNGKIFTLLLSVFICGHDPF